MGGFHFSGRYFITSPKPSLVVVEPYRGASTVQAVMARNEVSLLLSLYAYQILHGLRCLLVHQTRQGWSLSRMREQVLKITATLSLHARRITVHLGDAADKWWPSNTATLMGTLNGCRV